MSLREVRLKQALFAMVLGGALTVTGCASTGTMGTGEADNAQTQAAADGVTPSESQKVSVEYINIVGDGDRVLIGTNGQVKYTVFKLSDPARLIIDMPGIDLSKVSSSMAVGNDYMGEITAVTYGDDKDIGRIVIALNENIDHEVKTGDNSILVSLMKITGEQPAGSIIAASSETITEEALEAAPENAVEEALPEEPARAARAASKVLKVSSSKDGGNTIIRIATDGLAANFNSFVLSDPARIVVDVIGVSNSTGVDSQKFKDSYLSGVRIGSYADKARLVFDGSAKKLPPHSITVKDGAIVLAIGPGVVAMPKAAPAMVMAAPAPAPEAAVKVETEAPAPEMAAAPAEGPKVENVDYKKVGDKGRLTIVSSSKPEYRIREGKDGKTVVLDIKNVLIPEAFTRTLDASKLNTMVASVSSYQESLSPRSVRVLVKLKDKASYTVQELGNSLAIDFVQAASAPAADAETQTGKSVLDKGIKIAEPEYNGKRIDLDMMDANVSDVLRLLAEISNLNIVASDDVKGTISLRLKNVPWAQAFESTSNSQDLEVNAPLYAEVPGEARRGLDYPGFDEHLGDSRVQFGHDIPGLVYPAPDVLDDEHVRALVGSDISPVGKHALYLRHKVFGSGVVHGHELYLHVLELLLGLS